MKPINTVFIGSSHEGAEILKTLNLSEKYRVTGVITQPDRPAGRKQISTPTQIKKTAINLGIPIFEPDNKKEEYEKALRKTKPELIVCIAFGEFIPNVVLEYPKHKCLNIHYSLLPELRGACPVQAAILRGLKKTGVTIQVMEEKMDVGPVIAQKEIEISEDETTETLKEKLIPLGHNLLMKILPDWIEGKIKPRIQDETKATYCYMKDMSKKSAKIDWKNEDSEVIDRKIRALSSWPVAWTIVNSKRLKIFEAEIAKSKTNDSVGKLIEVDGEPGFPTKDGKNIILKSVQLEGKNRMSGKEFWMGFKGGEKKA